MPANTPPEALEKLKKQGEELEELIHSSLGLEDGPFFQKITNPLVGGLVQDCEVNLLSPI